MSFPLVGPGREQIRTASTKSLARASLRDQMRRFLAPILATCFTAGISCLASEPAAGAHFPRPLSEYAVTNSPSIVTVLTSRFQEEPFNLVATVIFILAILHTFLAPFFTKLSHRYEAEHRERTNGSDEVSFRAQVFHFLGEVEAIFGIWIIPLLIAITISKGWSSAKHYFHSGLNFTEPLFVVVIMAIAASRPILRFAEQLMSGVARIGKQSAAAWWLSILTVAPVLGSFITEPAAMTIGAILLGQKFYDRKPSATFAYATLGLLFVNVSIGGVLTNFAAPPVLMVAGKWGWGTAHMLTTFGWKAVLAIVTSNCLYYFIFRKEFARMLPAVTSDGDAADIRENRNDPIPFWITAVHIVFLAWTVLNSHYPSFFIGGFLFYLAFSEATEHHQNELRLRQPLMVGFFLAGLVVHGGLQGWWLEPVLSRLDKIPLLLGATVLTGFNDNAAITYLASLVPSFSPELKYAVMAGALAGGGLTVIANAPNPAGQSILSKFFPDGVSPVKLFLGALAPTVIAVLCFLIFS